MSDGVQRVDVDAMRARCAVLLGYRSTIAVRDGALVGSTPIFNLIGPQDLIALLDTLAVAEAGRDAAVDQLLDEQARVQDELRPRMTALETAVRALMEQAASWLAQYTDDDGSMWNVGWIGGSSREMLAAIEQSRAALGEAASATREE